MHCIETFYYGHEEKEYGVVNDDLEKFQIKGDTILLIRRWQRVVDTLNSTSIRFSFIVVVNPYIHIQKFLIVHKFVSL